MKEILVIRDKKKMTDDYTLGECFVDGNRIGVSLERGWLDNKNNISCIPEDTYEVVLEYSPKFKRYLWEIKGVEGRSECKFHAANYWQQLNGCISLGREIKDINGDGVPDITASIATIRKLHMALGEDKKACLTIKSA